MNTCKHCKGSGRAHEAWQDDDGCTECENKGWVPDPEDGGTMSCPECNGESSEWCEYCEGTGWDETN